jgi:hypothetical protein
MVDSTAVSVTVVPSSTSTTAVDTGSVLVNRSGALPPSMFLMPLTTDSWPWNTSLDAIVCPVPELAPTGMVMTSPFHSVTTSGLPLTGVDTVTV